MAYLLVVALALLAGAWAYVATLRSGREQPVATGFDGDVEAEHPDDAGYTYLRVGTRGPSWSQRVQGFVGLMVLVLVGAALLAFAIYQLGHLVNLTIENFLE